MLDIILMIVAVILILLSLLQGGKTEGASGALTGASVNLFQNSKERGSEKFISRLTMIIGITFFVLVLIRVLFF